MASTFIGMGANKKAPNIDELKKENVKLTKANEKQKKELETLQDKLTKANEKISELETKLSKE